MNHVFQHLLLLAVFALVTNTVKSQSKLNLLDQKPDTEYENVHVKPLDKDEHACTYLIWVKEKVAEHYHAEHTEVVYIIEGEGTMTLNDETLKVKPGDYIFIPAETRHSVQVLSDTPMKALSVQTPFFDGSDRHFTSSK